MATIDLVKNYGSTEIIAGILGDVDRFKPQIFSLGEVNHFFAKRLRDTLSVLLPQLRKRGFDHFAIELRDQFQQPLYEFVSGQSIDELSNLVCNPKTGSMSANCKNRFQLDSFEENLDFVEDYANLLKSIQHNRLDTTCIDAPLLKANESAYARDNYMAEKLNALLEKGKHVIWFGGCRHMMIRGNVANKVAAELLSQNKHFRLVGLESQGQLPNWMNSTVERTELDELLHNLTAPYYVRTHIHKDFGNEVAYADRNLGEIIKYSHWDAAVFYP